MDSKLCIVVLIIAFLLDICEDHLRMYEASTDMLDRIIALDESYLRSYDPEDKQAAKR
jgi:hypothetical protein